MSVSPFDSSVYGAAFADAAAARLFDERAEIEAMLRVEATLALVQGALGLIPGAASAKIAQVASTLSVDPVALAAATARDGVPVPALVDCLRAALPSEIAAFAHWGLTSQDIMDTALVLRLRDACALHANYLRTLAAQLAQLADLHRATPIAARTRYQWATPTSFGLKLAGWLAPLLRQMQRLRELEPRLLTLQCGGAGGNLAALRGRGLELTQALAAALHLRAPAVPWHNQRDALAEYAGWLSLTTGALGKIGQDLVLLAQNEIGEVHLGEGGASSAMPHKHNPVGAELLVTLARFNATQLGAMHQAQIHAQERDGAAWSLEWLSLPPMVVATGTALMRCTELLQTLTPDVQRMQHTIDISLELIWAENAIFALALRMDAGTARALIKHACALALQQQRPLFDVLAALEPAIDWRKLREDITQQLGSAEGLIDRVLRDWRTEQRA